MKTKYLSFTGELEMQSIRPLLESLDEARFDETIDQVQLTLVSYGGFFTSAFALYDIINNFSKPIDVVAGGSCQSCAVLVLQSGRKRYSYEHTDFLLHHPAFSVPNQMNLANFQQTAKEYEREEKIYWKILSKKTQMSADEMRKYCEVDQSFDAQKALKLGLIDEIIKKD